MKGNVIVGQSGGPRQQQSTLVWQVYIVQPKTEVQKKCTE